MGDRKVDVLIDKHPHEPKNYHDNYVRHGNQLRLWLVTFGVGALIFVFTDPELAEGLKQSEHAWIIRHGLFWGLMAQVASLFVYKYTAQIHYHEILGRAPEKLADIAEFCNTLWIEFIADCITIAGFSLAIYWLLAEVLKTPGVSWFDRLVSGTNLR